MVECATQAEPAIRMVKIQIPVEEMKIILVDTDILDRLWLIDILTQLLLAEDGGSFEKLHDLMSAYPANLKQLERIRVGLGELIKQLEPKAKCSGEVEELSCK